MLATTAVILSESGAIDLDQPLGAILGSDAGWLHNVSWLEILAHTGGFPFELQADWWHDENSVTDEELGEALARVRPLPHRHWHYSNAGYQVVALALKAATTESWERLVDMVLWQPAGMTRTTVQRDETGEVSARLAAGGVITTLEDLCRFGLILAGHNSELLPPDSLRILTAPRAIAGPGVLQAAGVQLVLGDRTQLLAWGTLYDTTVGLIAQPGLHAVAVSKKTFAAGAEVRTRLLESSEAVRQQVVADGLGLWWLDGVGVEVVVAGDRVVARDPNSAVTICSIPTGNAIIGEDRIDLPPYRLWRNVEDSAW